MPLPITPFSESAIQLAVCSWSLRTSRIGRVCFCFYFGGRGEIGSSYGAQAFLKCVLSLSESWDERYVQLWQGIFIFYFIMIMIIGFYSMKCSQKLPVFGYFSPCCEKISDKSNLGR